MAARQVDSAQIAEEIAQKRERLEARVSAEQKELFQRAAALRGQSLSEFVVASTQHAAEQIIREHDVLALSARDSQMFVEALLNPPAPGAKLRAAAASYKREILGQIFDD